MNKKTLIKTLKNLELYDYILFLSKEHSIDYLQDTIILKCEIEANIIHREEQLEDDSVYYDDELEMLEKLKELNKLLVE